MTEEARPPVGRRIIRIALPAIINNITVPLLGLCDTAVAGHLGNAVFLGAMSVGAMMLNVIFWLCGFLRMGTSGLTAQAFGAGDAPLGRDILRKSLMIAALISAAAIICRMPLLALLMRVVGADPGVSELAARYFMICIWGAPAQLGMMAVSGWFIGRQNTVVPMTVAIGVNVVNIALSLLLVFGMGFGFTGIAAGTLCAGWTGLAAALLFMRRELRAERQSRQAHRGQPQKARWSRFFSLNADLFFRSACIMGVSLAMTSVGARLGETALAANAVIMQFFLFFSYFMDGFAFAAEALVGKAAGAGDMAALRSSVGALLRTGAVMALIFLIIYFGGAGTITALLTDAAEVRDTVGSLNFWVTALPVVSVAAFIFDGIFIGLASTRPLLVTTVVAAAIFFMITFMLPFPGELPEEGMLWCAFESYLLARGILLACVYVKIQRKSLIL
ncbi:MAG: MATE family efflux transporter [Muribaculaceae bacterium]|nr:MATE family efflux transporter [Muribaculaceae bacterium]